MLHAATRRGCVGLLFPGQGSQFLGMFDLFLKASSSSPSFNKTVQTLCDTANSILGYDIVNVCQNGPSQLLNSTRVCQPAMFLSSMIYKEYLTHKGIDFASDSVVSAGLSLGEFSAIVFSGAVSFQDGMRLVSSRAIAMEESCNIQPTAMVNVVGLDDAKLNELMNFSTKSANEKSDDLSIALYLGFENRTVAGTVKSIDTLQKYAKSFGAKFVKRLPVEGAFHTKFMQHSKHSLEKAINQTPISFPSQLVLSNYFGRSYKSVEEIKVGLLEQLTNPVQWQKCVEEMLLKLNCKDFYEIGVGSTLSNMLRKEKHTHQINYTDITIHQTDKPT